MEFIVSMVRNSTEPGGRDRFSCGSGSWDLLLDLGRTFGWKPRGTTYLPARSSNRADTGARHDYRPGDDKDYKVVEADDAIGWATALREARRSSHLAAMLDSRAGSAALPDDAASTQARSENARFATEMDEFIEYAFSGAFTFARALDSTDME